MPVHSRLCRLLRIAACRCKQLLQDKSNGNMTTHHFRLCSCHWSAFKCSCIPQACSLPASCMFLLRFSLNAIQCYQLRLSYCLLRCFCLSPLLLRSLCALLLQLFNASLIHLQFAAVCLCLISKWLVHVLCLS